MGFLDKWSNDVILRLLTLFALGILIALIIIIMFHIISYNNNDGLEVCYSNCETSCNRDCAGYTDGMYKYWNQSLFTIPNAKLGRNSNANKRLQKYFKRKTSKPFQ